jgi:hypothetical protein
VGQQGDRGGVDLMLENRIARARALANLDVGDPGAVRPAVERARQVGHWRRLLAIYGDHLPWCASLRSVDTPDGTLACDCGFEDALK